VRLPTPLSIVAPALALALLTLAGAAAANDGSRIHAHLAAELEATPARGSDQLQLRVDGTTLVLSLEDNLGLLSTLDSAQRQAALAGGNRFVSGRIEGISESWLRLSMIENRWAGAYFDGSELFLLDPIDAVREALVSPAPKSAGYVVYRLRDVELPGLLDEIVEVPAGKRAEADTRTDYAGFARHLGAVSAGSAASKNAVRQLRLTVVTDTEFSSVHGGNRDAVVASRVNIVDGIYTDQFQTRIVVGELRHLSANDTLNTTVVSGSDSLLLRFRTFMNSGAGSSIPKGGLNHLFSGKDFDGSTVGVAYVNVLCSSSFGYGINQVRAANSTTALTIAHEMGHNFGASHDGQSGSSCEAQTGTWLMSPSINGSNMFSPCARTVVVPRINVANCLQPVSSVGRLFANGFER